MIFRANALRMGVQRLALQQKIRLASTTPSYAPSGGGSLVPNSLLNSWYNVFGKSSALYTSWVVMLIVVGEFATGKITDSLWTMSNYGKTFDTVDWSKFDQFEDEDGEEEGEEEEEEEEEDDE